MSVGLGAASLCGMPLEGPVRAFNLGGELDCVVKRMAFVTSTAAIYTLDVMTGAVALLQGDDLQVMRRCAQNCDR